MRPGSREPQPLRNRPAWLESGVAAPLTGMCPPAGRTVRGRSRLDAHKRTQTIVAIDEHGRKIPERTIGTTPKDHLGVLRVG